jgi:hypothetical protein
MTEGGDTEVHRPDVKQMTHENFLAMLKGLPAGEKEDATTSSSKAKALDSDNKPLRAKEGTVAHSSSSRTADAPSGSSVTWNALKDDYPLGSQSMALKVINNHLIILYYSTFPSNITITFSLFI